MTSSDFRSLDIRLVRWADVARQGVGRERRPRPEVGKSGADARLSRVATSNYAPCWLSQPAARSSASSGVEISPATWASRT